MIRSLSVRRVPRPLAVVLSVALAAVALPCWLPGVGAP